MQTQSSTSVPLPLTWFNINDYNASALTKLYVHVMQITAWLLILAAGMLDAFKFQQPFFAVSLCASNLQQGRPQQALVTCINFYG